MNLIPNPWIILAFVLALAGTAFISYEEGHGNGVAAEKVRSQAEFDKVNKQIAANKVEANRLLAEAAAKTVLVLGERDALKTQLETERQANEKKNRDLRTEYSAYKLRFAIPAGSGRGPNGDATPNTGSGAASAAVASVVVELPDAIAESLRQLAFDADELLTAYGVCYGYATKVR
jgi:hypothetical protein